MVSLTWEKVYKPSTAMLTTAGTITDVLCLSTNAQNAHGVVLGSSPGANPDYTHNFGLIFLYSETAIKIILGKTICIIKGKLQNTGFKTAFSSKR